MVGVWSSGFGVYQNHVQEVGGVLGRHAHNLIIVNSLGFGVEGEGLSSGGADSTTG